MVSLEFLVTRDNRNAVMRKVLNWLMEGVNWGPGSLPLNTTLDSWITFYYLVSIVY
jgi:hypothetical protein